MDKEDRWRFKDKDYIRGWKIFFYVLVAFIIAAFIAVTVVLFIYLQNTQQASNPPVVESLNLTQFAGTWYEIARLPNPFENGCFNATQTFLPNADGSLSITNSCTSNGRIVTIKATGWAYGGVDFEGSDLICRPGQLTVFFGPVGVPYWVVSADVSTYTYAMIGSPSRKFLWILSREKTLDDSVYSSLVEIARKANFPTQNLLKTVQL